VTKPIEASNHFRQHIQKSQLIFIIFKDGVGSRICLLV